MARQDKIDIKQYILSKTDIQSQYDNVLYQEDGNFDKLKDDTKK